MKKLRIKFTIRTMIALALLTSANFLLAQGPLGTATMVSSYHFQSGSGTNASAVVFIPGPNVFITVIAGNATYPMEVFDAQGSTLYSTEVGIDIRGLWYNPATKNLEANAYGEEGWFSMKLDGKGFPTGDWQSIKAGQFQPEEQSVLSYDPKIKKLVTLSNGFFSYWGRKNGKEKVRVQHGTPGDTDWYLNPYVAAYTGNDAFPIAVLELNGNQILFFDVKGLYLGASVVDGGLPEIDGFRFSFAGNRAWIYDESTRTWNGYKVF